MPNAASASCMLSIASPGELQSVTSMPGMASLSLPGQVSTAEESPRPSGGRITSLNPIPDILFRLDWAVSVWRRRLAVKAASRAVVP